MFSSITDKIKGAADAAQSTVKEETSKVDTVETPVPDPAHSTDEMAKGKLDTGKLAGAAGDILSSVSDYANLKDSSAGQYVEKAETYLHDYKEKNSAAATTPTPTPETGAPKE